MTSSKEEAVPIARLMRSDTERTIGWVYLWNTSELSILWIDRRHRADRIEPPVDRETLAKARSVTDDEVASLLDMLSNVGEAGTER